ncbi:MAG: rhamnogalacturonan acetylesterase [Balneolaceae bacterium]|nr:rhamnogalacturonan acetylesterase [Balneolaceae bacterium]
MNKVSSVIKRRNQWGFLAVLAIGLLCMAAMPQPDSIKIYLVGDSTMSDKQVRAWPETGWGMPFPVFFNETVTVENHAVNGRSTRTFLEEGRWEPIVSKLQEGDYVFVQFAHNDEVPTKEQYTKPENYQANLRKYVSETRAKGARPVLLTPIARRHFDDQGRLQDTHAQYSELMREVARELEVPLIDLDKKSQALLKELGPEKSVFLYNHLEPGQHPNYPEGLEDNTHFSEYGARRMAELALDGIQELDLDLADRVVN